MLVVDDEEGVRTFLADALTDAGYAVAQAADGEAALALLARRAFHVVLTDLRMPARRRHGAAADAPPRSSPTPRSSS